MSQNTVGGALPTLLVAATSLRQSGWDVTLHSPLLPPAHGSRINCEWRDITSPALAKDVAAYKAAISSRPKLFTDVEEAELAKHENALGMFGLAFIAGHATRVQHTGLHYMGFAAADHARTHNCSATGAGLTDLSASLAIASLTPAWAGLQHGLLAGGLRSISISPTDPRYGPLAWSWALSHQARARLAVAAVLRIGLTRA